MFAAFLSLPLPLGPLSHSARHARRAPLSELSLATRRLPECDRRHRSGSTGRVPAGSRALASESRVTKYPQLRRRGHSVRGEKYALAILLRRFSENTFVRPRRRANRL